ncbi:MAG: beta-glucosidase [Rhodopseudomonas sp.]|uniref:GH1 family beta-glucosidase n=1 Tax=Rhodopseudomonas sp. TaxID=1078 RepID=UPI0017D96A0E|nr:GH1 family beta-glucosidase [Rhodopseudomonas sp.]NVN84494.1 beta-glucosidase [Rhodopseudomonas sp.]
MATASVDKQSVDPLPGPPSIPHLSKDFIWGVSTSSFQIEGATQEDGRGLSIWDSYGRTGQVRNNDTGDIACDHYHRYKEDVALMRTLGIQAYRFSVAWPRVLPNGTGAVNEAGLAFYDRLIDELLASDIEPWLCLYHWDLPQALEDRGGWMNRESVAWFTDYATLIGKRYGRRVKRFATFNEPAIFSLFSRSFGTRDRSADDKLNRWIHHVNLAHGAAVDALRAQAPGALIGCIHNYQPIIPSSASEADVKAAALVDAYWNQAYPDPQYLGEYPQAIRAGIEPHMQPGDLARIHRPLDWFGLNHYSPVYINSDPSALIGMGWGPKPAEIPRTPIDWTIEPDAFRDTLLTVSKRYGLPVYVTENGYGRGDDEKPDEIGAVADPGRVDFLRSYISALDAAVAAGADVRGYFVWSLLDNFEWDSGYSVRFGLTYIDYKTQRRIPKSSFKWYADVIRLARGLTPAA